MMPAIHPARTICGPADKVDSNGWLVWYAASTQNGPTALILLNEDPGLGTGRWATADTRSRQLGEKLNGCGPVVSSAAGADQFYQDKSYDVRDPAVSGEGELVDDRHREDRPGAQTVE